jgi:hypothetical protein
MITVLLWKKSCIDLFIERLDIVLSDFCPNICPWACHVYVWAKLMSSTDIDHSYDIHISLVSVWKVNFVLFNSMLKYVISVSRDDNSPLWKKSCIDLFIERLDIVLSDFCPNICPWACHVYVWAKLMLLLINM